MKKIEKVTIITFYKFHKIKNLEEIKKEILVICKKRKILGTILIAEEGINGTISGNCSSILLLKKFLLKKIHETIYFKETFCVSNPFLRIKIKIKKEIIKLGISNINPEKFTGKYIKPENWNDIIEDENVIVVDTRNDYETEIGSFKNSLNPKTKNFSEFPKWVNKNKTSMIKKKLALFCTGGIRCEKASSFLIMRGFKEVYQLEGGIINYLKKINIKNSRWEGDCFVFDDRVTVDHNLKKGNYTQCFACKSALKKKDTFSKYYKKGISCHKCYKKTSFQRKSKLEEREKQIKLSEIRGLKHLGNKS